MQYEDELSLRLRSGLKLPETGDVKVSITLNRQGKVIKTEIISSKSTLNRRAIETIYRHCNSTFWKCLFWRIDPHIYFNINKLMKTVIFILKLSSTLLYAQEELTVQLETEEQQIPLYLSEPYLNQFQWENRTPMNYNKSLSMICN